MARITAAQGFSGAEQGAPCKTVGSAYVGSNPTPATQNPRSEPLTRTCVSGSNAESKRFRRPLADVVGHTWARSVRSRGLLVTPVAGIVRLLNCGNGHRSSKLGVLAAVTCGWQAAVRARGCGPCTDIWRTGSGRYRRFAEPLAFGHCAWFLAWRACSICRLVMSSWPSMQWV